MQFEIIYIHKFTIVYPPPIYHSFDFISAPLVHPRYKREFFDPKFTRPGPTTRSDKVISSSDWTSLVVAKLSPWIRLDSKDETVRRNSEKVGQKAKVKAESYSVF